MGEARNRTGAPGRLAGVPVYPFLLAMLPAVHFYEVNVRLLGWGDLVRPVLLGWAVSALVLLAGRLVWRGFGRAALAVTPLLAVVFKGADLGGPISLGALLLSGFLGVLLHRRADATWPRRVTPALNAALAVLVLLPLVAALRAGHAENTPVPSAEFHAEVPLPARANSLERPDIYYLLVDGLGQPAFVEAGFPLSRTQYSEPFARRGFQVLRHGLANYPQTALSTAATLNMAPIDRVLEIADPASRDRRVLAEVVGHSRVVRALRRLGYRIVDYPSGYPLTRQSLADARRSAPLDPSFVEYYLLEDGVLPLLLPLLGRGPADVSFALRRGRLDHIFDHLADARRGAGPAEPVFVFAHILAPHPPFVWGPQGEALRSRATFGFADGDHWLNIHGPDDRSYRQRYADQAVWVVQRLTRAIDQIIAASDRPKVIIVQGDHGPGSGLWWERPAASDHNERFGIFNAWYVSDGRRLPLYEGMTAVNTFPLLFNEFFGAELPALPDRLWFARMSEPYAFFEMEN